MTPAVGRFAPTPSGALHLGSLMVALASYLSIKQQQGQWLLRWDDGDTPRVRPGAEAMIKQQLEACGLVWDGETRQSQRQERYHAALNALIEKGLTYPCCCRRQPPAPCPPTRPSPSACPCYPTLPAAQSLCTKSLRFRLPNTQIRLQDRLRGEIAIDLATRGGDFLVRRQDGLLAYQLMSAVDDAPMGDMGVTEVVRGADLMDSSARQQSLQELWFGQRTVYVHLPLLLDETGKKLSKSAQSLPINQSHPTPALIAALTLLGQPVSEAWRENTPPAAIIAWALAHWQTALIPQVDTCQAPMNR